MTTVARPLCAAPHCRSRGRHLPDCPGGDCVGCLPHLAADGLRLCEVCARRLAEDAVQAAELHGELALRLLPTGGGGERVDASRGARVPDPRAMEARREIRHVLVSLVRMICEERGVRPPGRLVPQPLPFGLCGPWALVWRVDGRVSSLGEFVAQHGDWLAAHPAAGEFAGELRSLVVRSWRVAYPSGAHVAEIGPCPHGDGTVRAIVRQADSLLPSEATCDGDDSHTWSAAEWHALGRAMRRVA